MTRDDALACIAIGGMLVSILDTLQGIYEEADDLLWGVDLKGILESLRDEERRIEEAALAILRPS